jgi:UDP-glucose:(heptosyl)LPS alpha-1,3-glucosyltransferase
MIIERHDVALGGAERSISELICALERAGVEVDLLAAKGQQAKNVHILCGGQDGRTGLREFSKAVQEHIAANRYDIVHSTLPMHFADVYQPRGGSYAETIIRNAASYENSVIAWAKVGTSWLNLRRLEMLKAEEALCRKKDGPAVAALSQYVVEQFKAHYGVPAERIELIPNGIKLEKRADAETADKLRGQMLVQLGIQEATNPIIFFFAAHNFRLKGLGPLVRAMGMVSKLKNDRTPMAVVAGEGKAMYYKLLAAKCGVRKKVLFTGRVKNVSGMLAASDVAVLPSFYDPCSRFILEGLAAGRPVITTSSNGACERYESGRHGMTIEHAGDAPELARAMSFYCREDNAIKASKAIDEDGLAEGLSVEKHAEQLVKLYERLIQRRGSR